nr:DUF4329 domain-containing protein [Duganella violaceicalia]
MFWHPPSNRLLRIRKIIMQKRMLKAGQRLWSCMRGETHRICQLRSSLKWLLSILALWLGMANLALPGDVTSPSVAPGSMKDILMPGPATHAGQSATQLSDGNWLLLGGRDGDDNAGRSAVLFNSKTATRTALNARLAQGRSEHSATLLADGTVLVLGGIDSADAVLNIAERFNPATGQFTALGDLGLIARAGHTATVLTDASVLISGGWDQHGHLVAESEIYRPDTRKIEHFNIKLNTARTNHLAALLPSANVLLWGGLDGDRKRLDDSEEFEYSRLGFNPVTAEAAAELSRSLLPSGTPRVKDSRPAAESHYARVDEALMVRFSQRMAVDTLGNATVTLIGPNGTVPVTVVPVEKGLLLFVTPQQDLLPSSRYTLFISGARDDHGQPLPFTAVGFDTMQLAAPATPGHATGDITAEVAPVDSTAAPENAGPAPSRIEMRSARSLLGGTERQAIASAAAMGGSEAWLPNASHFKGDWRANRRSSPLQALPPLQAASGETALSGQVLTLNGLALENAILTIGGQSTRSDATGRFLLTNLTPGMQVLSIDGPGSGPRNAHYGYYQTRVDIKRQQTNVLGYTIWSARLDPAGDMALPSPTPGGMVASSPRIPGLELHIPAGTVIRDHNGKIVTKINMTAIPTDRPPFPIPGVGVPVYFTIQPGGATLASATGRMQGAQLIYPNFSAAAPGTRIDFWNYDTQAKGWYVYGQGTVTPDGKQVMPDAGVAIYEFTGAMVSLPSNAPKEGPPPGGCGGSAGGAVGSDDCNGDPNQPAPPDGCAGDPVDCATGLFLDASTDLVVADVVPLIVKRSYRPRDPASRSFGIGTNLSYDFYLVGDTYPYTYQDLILPDGGRVHYVRTSPGTGYLNAVYEHVSTPTKYLGSTIRFTTGGPWQLQLKDGSVFLFPEAEKNPFARKGAVTEIRDRYGNTTKLARDPFGRLTRVTSPSGRSLQFVYDTVGRIVEAGDNIGRVVSYEYDPGGHLVKAVDPDGNFKAYTYDTNHNMLTVRDKRGNIMVANVYDVNNRVSKQTYADGSTNLFSYGLDTAGKVARTDVTDERGIVTRMLFNAQGYTTSVTRAYGLPEQQTVAIERDPATNLMLSRTDNLGRKTSYAYDAAGNLLARTALSGSVDAATTTMSYTSDFNRLSSVTDFLSQQTTMLYDLRGNLIETRDANGNVVRQDFNSAGQLTKITDGLGRSSSLDYDLFDLASVTDSLGGIVQFRTDGAGRVRNIIDALGNQSGYEVDVQDRLTRSTDPHGGATALDFDANGNTTGLTDPKGNWHQFSFDERNAPTSNLNPLGQAEAYAYDAKHNLIQKTDRKGQITRYAYDALDRLISTTYADGSTVSNIYDPGNRIVLMKDSASGDISFDYDLRDRVTQVSTSKGKVAYTYDVNGRRASMSVAGLPTLHYDYDPGGRLTRIKQDAGAANNRIAQSISFAYDAANRRIRTVYTNGIIRSDSYDDAGQLTSITYTKADGSMLGDLLYSYDKGGRRTQVAGSLARTALPEALETTTVDAANRLITVGSQTLGYDANGNLLDDGHQIYIWNARNQLIQIKSAGGQVVASFSYDALGRRQTKTVNGIATGYVYDGVNVLQELVGLGTDNSKPSDVRAGYVSGGIDEVFAQFVGTGASAKISAYLTDALGSTIRLVDAAGDKVVDYTYDPYGKSVADAEVHNPFQYTGRENDGTGLYYYRARYYAPAFGRFISSDPIGLSGGANTYRYVGDNPLALTDPWGLSPGTPYASQVEAARQATNDVIVQSILQNQEYGGMIYKNRDGTYSYTPPRNGGSDAVDPGGPQACPAGKIPKAYYHTHGAYDRNYDSENFSPADINYANRNNIDGYVGTPNSNFKYYNHTTGRQSVLAPVGSIP